MLSSVLYILLEVILPLMLIVAAGAALQRLRPLEIGTLTRMQVYLFVPMYLFVRISESRLSVDQMGRIALAVLIAKFCLAAPLWWIARRLGMSRERTCVFVLACAVFNAGNFGIPLAERAYPGAGGAVQSVILMLSNITLWGFGSLMMTLAANRPREGWIEFARQPLIVAIVAAFLLRATGFSLPSPLSYSCRLIASGLVPVALITLGAQLAQQARWPHWRVVLPVMLLKMGALPAITAGVVWLLGLWPWPGAMIIVATSAPTAVNVLLLTLERGGDGRMAAEGVFWTTLASAITVTATLAIVKSLGGVPDGS